MGYVALYRQWRPMKFSEVVGQTHIVRTLKNAFERNRISHAYLFCGPRGTGKTSMAKILAKTVNCLDLREGEPCNKCLNCEKVNAGTALDVLEIDAASNRGIDEIRDLREKIKLSPVEGKYKVYIIDEVHMLTTEAFNALLKTLEEPPSHVIFILATTEPHKIPLTILSRCQRFDFHRIGVVETVERLKEILQANNIETEERALYLIAKIAAGGMRDALSLLDQCIVSGADQVTSELVTSIAGIVTDEFMLELVSCIHNKDVNKCLTILYQALNEGKDVRQLLADLVIHFRNLLILKLGSGSRNLLTVPDELLSSLEEQSKLFTKDDLLIAIRSLSQAENDIKWSSQGQILLELNLLKLIDEMGKPSFAVVEQESVKVKAKVEINSPSKMAASPEPEKKKVAAVQAAPTQESAADAEPEVNLELIKAKWSSVLDIIRKESVMSYAFFIEAIPFNFSGNVLTLQYKLGHKFHKERSEQPDNKKVIEAALHQVVSPKLKINFVLDEGNSGKDEEQDDIVKKAIEFFGEDVVEVED